MFLTNLVLESDTTLPSFFEMTAESRLIEGLRPAFRTLLQAIGRHQSRFESVISFDDEIFTVMQYLIEFHHLFEFDSTFSENFYGLKREAIVGPLQPIHRHRSMWTLVLLPYLKRRLDDTYETHVERQHLDNTLLPRWAHFYPWLKWVFNAVSFIYQVLFMFGKSPFFSPLLHMIGVRVVRVSIADIVPRAKTQLVSSWLFIRLLHRFSSLFARYFKWALLGSIFTFKIMEWWYASEETLNPSKSLPVPPPPPMPKLPIRPHLCSICGQRRQNPACTPTGYAFCWLCIYNFVKERGRCPMTNAPCSETQIRKIYEN